MKQLIILFLSIFITSCNNDEKYSDEEVCLILNRMVSEDQAFRSLPEFNNYNTEFHTILDSIKLKKGVPDKKFDSLSEKQQNTLKESAKNILDKRSKINWDSIADLQAQIDIKNTELLIDIISHKGWPNKDSLNCNQFGPPVLIFRHAPEEYFDTIRSIIDKEYAENRMVPGDYMFIENHLEGRPMFNFETVEE